MRDEDFAQAASLKATIREMRASDAVTEIERRFRRAIASEDYAQAAKYRDAGAGLVGWWAGRGATEEEPGGAYGVMMQVTAEHGRYVGRVHGARSMLQEVNRRRGAAGRGRREPRG